MDEKPYLTKASIVGYGTTNGNGWYGRGSGEWEDEGGMTYQMRNQVRIDECKLENEAMSSISVDIAFGGITST